MKKSKYLEKMVDRMEEALEEAGISDDYVIDWDVTKVDGTKHPIMTIEFPNGETEEFDLLGYYNRHEEEDISMAESFRGLKAQVFDLINEFDRSDNLEEYEEDIEDEDEYEDEEEYLTFYVANRTFCQNRFATRMRPIYMENVFNDLVMVPCTSDSDYFYRENMDIFDWEEAKENVNVSLFCISSCDNFLIMDDLTGMFSDRTMNSVASQLGTKDFYIVPVSTDKIIFVKKAEYSYSAIKSTFERIRADVPEHQRISADIYEYDFEEKTPKISEQREAERVHETPDNETNEQIAEIRAERQSLHPDAQMEYRMQEQESEEEQAEEDPEESHDADYFAEYDTYDPAEFARTMVDLFNFRLGHNFHLSGNDGMQLTDSNNLVSLDMNEANTEYQNNDKDFLEYGDYLVDRFKELEIEAIEQKEQEDDEVEESLNEEDTYPDDCLPF